MHCLLCMEDIPSSLHRQIWGPFVWASIILNVVEWGQWQGWGTGKFLPIRRFLTHSPLWGWGDEGLSTTFTCSQHQAICPALSHCAVSAGGRHVGFFCYAQAKSTIIPPCSESYYVTEAASPGWCQKQHGPNFRAWKHIVSHEEEVNSGIVAKRLEN